MTDAGLFLPGPNDGKGAVASTRLDGMADHAVAHTSQTRLAAHPEAVAPTLSFLRRGAFAPTSSGRAG